MRELGSQPNLGLITPTLAYQFQPEEPVFHLFSLWTSVVMMTIAYLLSMLVDNVLVYLLGPYHYRVLASSVFNFLRALSGSQSRW